MKYNSKMSGKSIASYIFLIFTSFAMVIPFMWMLSTAFKEPADVFKLPPQWIPRPVRLKNFQEVFQFLPFARMYLNSIIVSTTITFGHLLISSLAAFAFTRLDFPGRDIIFLMYLSLLMLPEEVTIIPRYIMMKNFGWIDKYQGLIVPLLLSVFGIFLLRQFFITLPKDLDDAAIVDGASWYRVYWQITLPLSKPVLSALAIFSFTGSWNNFLWPLIITNSDWMKTIPVGLAMFQDLYTIQWNQIMAASTIAVIPVLVVYILNQRFFTQGIVLTGLKE